MSSRYDEWNFIYKTIWHRFRLMNTKQFKFGIYATGIAKYNGWIQIFPREIYITKYLMVSRSRALFHNNFRFFKFLLISSNKELTKEHIFFCHYIHITFH